MSPECANNHHYVSVTNNLLEQTAQGRQHQEK
jgi:hypothetical protein